MRGAACDFEGWVSELGQRNLIDNFLIKNTIDSGHQSNSPPDYTGLIIQPNKKGINRMSTQAPNEAPAAESQQATEPAYDPSCPWAGLDISNPVGERIDSSALDLPIDPEKWLESWDRARYLAEYTGLLHNGLGVRDRQSRCPLLNWYLLLADGHYRGDAADIKLNAREKLSRMAFKMLCNRVFVIKGNDELWHFVYLPEHIAMVMYFFRKRQGESRSNIEDISNEQWHAVRGFLTEFVVQHWIQHGLAEKTFATRNRYAALRMAYENGVLWSLYVNKRWRFKYLLSEDDAAMFASLLRDPALNGWGATVQDGPLPETHLSSNPESALAARCLMEIASANTAKK